METESGSVAYPDIIFHPHHVSPTHPQMTLYDRAAQFSAFDALAGFSDMVREEARWTNAETWMDEDEKDLLDRQLGLLSRKLAAGAQPVVTVTVFTPDERKDGGAYQTRSVRVKGIDTAARALILTATTGRTKLHERIALDRIIGMEGEALDEPETQR